MGRFGSDQNSWVRKKSEKWGKDNTRTHDRGSLGSAVLSIRRLNEGGAKHAYVVECWLATLEKRSLIARPQRFTADNGDGKAAALRFVLATDTLSVFRSFLFEKSERHQQVSLGETDASSSVRMDGSACPSGSLSSRGGSSATITAYVCARQHIFSGLWFTVALCRLETGVIRSISFKDLGKKGSGDFRVGVEPATSKVIVFFRSLGFKNWVYRLAKQSLICGGEGLMCRQDGSVITCKRCGGSEHPECHGFPDKQAREDYICSTCLMAEREEVVAVRLEEQGELGVVYLEDWRADSRTTYAMRDENVCCICGCEDNEDFDCLVPCPCEISGAVVHPGCAATCKEDARSKVSSKQTVLPCNICGEQGLVTNSGTGGMSPKSGNKSAEKMPAKPIQSGRGMKRSHSIATNGVVEKIGEECESPQQEVPLLGRRFNDAAATVPIKKRRIQMVEVVRSPSPPTRLPSPIKVLQSLSLLRRMPSPVSEHVLLPPRALVVSEHVGDVLSDDSCRRSVSSVAPTEDHINTPSLQTELAIAGVREIAVPGSEVQADMTLPDQLTLPQEETGQATELGLVVSRYLTEDVAEPSDFSVDTCDVSAKKVESPITDADDKGVLFRLTAGESQKVEFPVNGMDYKLGVPLSSSAAESAQKVECPMIDADDKGAVLLRSNSGYARDARLHWDLNMEMEAWEQASNEKLGADNLPDIKGNTSESGNSSSQTISGKTKDNSENTREEVNSRCDDGVCFDGQSGEGDGVEARYVAESFEYDAFDEEDEPISDSDNHVMEYAEEDQGENRQHENLNDCVEDVGEELEAEEHVDYGDSDCRDADDIGLEGDERLCVALQAESTWKDDEPTGDVEPQVTDMHVSLEGGACLERGEREPNSHAQRESHGTRSGEMREEDGELLSQSDGSKMQDSQDNLLDLKGVQESARREGEEQESEGERVVQNSESNFGSRDVSGKSELQHEVDNQSGPTSNIRLQTQLAPGRTRSTGWDQLPEGFDSVEDALRAAKGSSACRGGVATWSVSNTHGSSISAHGVSNGGRYGSGAIRGISSRIDGNLGERGRSYDMTRDRENNSRHRRLEDGIDNGSRYASSREVTRGRYIGRGSGACLPGRLRVEPWMDAPGGQWGPGRRRSPGRYSGSVGRSSGTPTNAAALAAAKVQSSGFVVAPDGTIIKAGGATSAGRGGMRTLAVGRGRGISMNAGRGPSMDGDVGTNFRMRFSMASQRLAGPMSKLIRRTPPPTSKWSSDNREEDRARDRDCKRPVSHVHSPSRRTSPHVVHGSALTDERDRQVLAVARQMSPTRPKQSEQVAECPLEFQGRSMDGNLDARRFKREHDDTGRFSGAYHRSSPTSGIDRDRDRKPVSSSRRERSREEERRREKFLSRDGRHISGFKHTNIRDVDDDVAPRRRRAS